MFTLTKALLIMGSSALFAAGTHTDRSQVFGRATLSPKSKSSASGRVEFSKNEKGRMVVLVLLKGLKPGKHGFHVHEKGDCSAEDASSAGGHFNPAGSTHGSALSGKGHAGDFANVVADAKGEVKTAIELPAPADVSVFIGKSLVLHEKEDDLKTDPTGNSGARIACGVIEAKTP